MGIKGKMYGGPEVQNSTTLSKTKEQNATFQENDMNETKWNMKKIKTRDRNNKIQQWMEKRRKEAKKIKQQTIHKNIPSGDV